MSDLIAHIEKFFAQLEHSRKRLVVYLAIHVIIMVVVLALAVHLAWLGHRTLPHNDDHAKHEIERIDARIDQLRARIEELERDG